MSYLNAYMLKVQKEIFINYCYIVADKLSKEALLIDPAWQPELILENINQNQLVPRAILLTHHHPDHIDLADYFAKYFQIPVYMSETEIFDYGFNCLNLNPIKIEQEFFLGNFKIHPIFTPGHTSGSICYLIENYLFTGDTLFNEGCGICSGLGADPYMMFHSLQKLKSCLEWETIIYPGHCYGLPIGQNFRIVLENNLYLQFSEIELFVAFRMRKNQSSWFNFQAVGG